MTMSIGRLYFMSRLRPSSRTAPCFESTPILLRITSALPLDRILSVRASSDGVLESSFTRSMRQRSLGPKALRRKVYRNLNEEDFVLVSAHV